MAVCKFCNRDFTPATNRSGQQRYCSDACRRDRACARLKATSPDRRPGHPATSTDPVSDEAAAFGRAMEAFKKKNRRPFPTWSEVIEVAKSLGYRKPE